VIGELQEPHFKCASANVKSSRRTVQFKKNILRNFLGLSGIMENPKGNRQHQAVVAVKELCKSVAIPLLHLRHQFFIGRLRRSLVIGARIPVSV
jgi:hypothetical protein